MSSDTERTSSDLLPSAVTNFFGRSRRRISAFSGAKWAVWTVMESRFGSENGPGIGNGSLCTAISRQWRAISGPCAEELDAVASRWACVVLRRRQAQANPQDLPSLVF